MGIMEQVLAAFRAGATTRKEIAKATSLDADLVDAAVDMLLRTGRMDERVIKTACTSGGCRGCAEDSSCHPAPIQIGRRP